MINKDEALNLLTKHLSNHNLIKHCQAVALVMEALAVRLGQNPNEWFITGLLHDIDYDLTYNDTKNHGIIAMKILQDTDISQEMKNAIQAHTGNFPIISLIDKGLWSADPITGLIIASALMNPEKDIKAVKLSSLIKKYKNKNFAAGANREQIASCTELNLTLEEFLELSLHAMQNLSIY